MLHDNKPLVSVEDLDLTPKKWPSPGEICQFCLPKPPKFSPVFGIDESFTQSQSFDADNTANEDDDDNDQEEEEYRPVDEVFFDPQAGERFDGTSLPELYDSEEEDEVNNSKKRGITLKEVQQSFFLGVFQMLFSLVFFRNWGEESNVKMVTATPHDNDNLETKDKKVAKEVAND